MDWPRIKTILIVVLLMTNLLLGAMIINEKRTFQQESNDRITNIRELYEQKNVTIEQQALNFPERIESLTVEYDAYGEDEVKWLLGESYEYDGIQYANKNEVVFLSGTTIEYYEKSRKPTFSLMDLNISSPLTEYADQERVRTICDQFLDKLKLPKDYVYEHYLINGDYLYLCVKQKYKDYFLDDSSMVIMIHDDEVVGLQRKWLNILDNNEDMKYDIISVDRALYMLMPSLEPGDVISDIAIGYKLNDSSLLVSELISGEALPYYKVTLSTGEVLYVQAVSSVN